MTQVTETSRADAAARTTAATRALVAAVERGDLREIEVSWPDQNGHPLGKRIPADAFLGRALGGGFAFCDAALAWNFAAEVLDDTRLTNWSTGYPDLRAIPDPGTFRRLTWREGTGHVIADVVDHHGHPVAGAPRAVLRRVVDRLASLGYTAQVGVELEFYLLAADGSPLQDAVHCYSLEKAGELDPVLFEIVDPLRGFVPVEGVNTEYGPGQVEVNLAHRDALTAADDAFRLKYATRQLARRSGALATFMAKPFPDQSGSSAHLHVSLWRGEEPAFAPRDGAENTLSRHAVGGILRHLPALTLFGAPTVNAYKRFTPDSFAPATVSWGGDNRTAALRSLVESPEATRLELRTPSADANPYWAVAALLAAIAAGIEDHDEPPARGAGNLYGSGAPLPAALPDAIAATRADRRLVALLGEDAVHDLTVLAESEWRAYNSQVTRWEIDRYLRWA